MLSLPALRAPVTARVMIVATNVESLRVGDYLIGSKRTVASAPVKRLGISSAKRELSVTDKRGDTYGVVWSAATRMKVERNV